MTAEEIIQAMGLIPLAGEGGWHREMWRSDDDKSVSYIYYLLRKGERSRWHKMLTSNEIWTWCAGGSLEMSLGGDGIWPSREKTILFGPRVGIDQGFTAAVPAGQWQATVLADGDWALVSCVVAPSFDPKDCYLPFPSVEEVEGI